MYSSGFVNSHQRLPEAEWSIRISEEVKGWSSLAKIGSASAQPQSEWAKGIRCLCWSSNLDWVGSPGQWHNRKSMKKQVFDTRCSSQCNGCQWNWSGFRCFGDTVVSSALGRTPRCVLVFALSKKQNNLANMCRSLHWQKFNG